MPILLAHGSISDSRLIPPLYLARLPRNVFSILQLISCTDSIRGNIRRLPHQTEHRHRTCTATSRCEADARLNSEATVTMQFGYAATLHGHSRARKAAEGWESCLCCGTWTCGNTKCSLTGPYLGTYALSQLSHELTARGFSSACPHMCRLYPRLSTYLINMMRMNRFHY